MTLTTVQALLFMALGAALMALANAFGWHKYYEGKREGRGEIRSAVNSVTKGRKQQ